MGSGITTQPVRIDLPPAFYGLQVCAASTYVPVLGQRKDLTGAKFEDSKGSSNCARRHYSRFEKREPSGALQEPLAAQSLAGGDLLLAGPFEKSPARVESTQILHGDAAHRDGARGQCTRFMPVLSVGSSGDAIRCSFHSHGAASRLRASWHRRRGVRGLWYASPLIL